MTTLKRIHEPVSDPEWRMTIRMLHLHAHFYALRWHPTVRMLFRTVLRALPQTYVAVHLRQELDILAISGCIDRADPRVCDVRSRRPLP